jgi:hypothetical protein
MLCTLWEYPADPALLALTKELLRVVSAGEQGDLRLLASDRVRYAVYDLDSGAGQVLYLLNTDPDCSSPVRVWVEGQLTGEQIIPANEFAVAYRFGPLVVWFADRLVDLQAVERHGETLDLTFASVNAQTVTLHNTCAAPCAVSLNGVTVSVTAGGATPVPLERKVAPEAPGSAPDFADEPPYEGKIDSQTAY